MEAAKELLDEGVIIRPECCTPESQSPPLHLQERFEHRPARGANVLGVVIERVFRFLIEAWLHISYSKTESGQLRLIQSF